MKYSLFTFYKCPVSRNKNQETLKGGTVRWQKISTTGQ